MKLDILAFGVHPDDVELGCGGTILASIMQGKKVGIIDFTRGELGTRGTAVTRDQEAKDASKILGISARENLEMADGFFQIDQTNIEKVIRVIRKYQPEVILCNSPEDRHPDHGRASALSVQASFLSGLIKISTSIADIEQLPWRPKHIFHYIQDRYLDPDFIFDISDFYEQKTKAILCYKTQFNSVDDSEPATYISNPEFMKSVEGRSLIFGKRIGVQHGEGFLKEKSLGITSFDSFILSNS